jgi:TRAP-type mannitol/chloroaromatic compound transport system permease small subunit
MKGFSPQIVRLTAQIDGFTDAMGLWIAWLNVPLVLAVTYEVVARYFFHAPTIWVYDVTYMLYGTIFMLGAAYALHKGAHIRTDFFFDSWSTRTKGMIDSIAYLALFFPTLTVFLFVSGDEAWRAFLLNEASEQTPWRPLLWPFKAVVPLTCFFLMVQGISEVIKSLYAVVTGLELEHKEKVEV